MFRTVSRGMILAVAFVFLAVTAQAQQYAALVMDARTGSVLYSRNADTRLHPASLTKMMTLYITFDEITRGRLSLDQKVTISKNAAAEPPSKLGLRAGQKIEVRYLIRAAAIKSANDAATALGEAIAGSESAFADRMTQYARAMGMTNTTFKNANGLTQEGHLSTARDMATLGRRLIYDFPQYYNIFSRTSTSAGIATVRNTNRRLLGSYAGADGIKTGYTRAAGFNLVSSAQRGNRRVIVALFGGKSTASRNAEVARLMDVGFAKMPANARIAALAPLRTVTASAPATSAGQSRGSTAPIVARRADTSLALVASGRPLPRNSGSDELTRSSESIAAAIAEVNAELVAAQAVARNAPARTEPVAAGRPMPRPGTSRGAQPMTAASASTFGVAPRVIPMARDEAALPPDTEIADASVGTGSTGRNDWGVQLGAYRAKGDAERQLLTTALKDVPELSGGLRRVEAARLQGATVYRAQFVGLTQAQALGACANLARMQADCLPLAPGI